MLFCIKSPDGHINPLTIAYGRNNCIRMGRFYLIAHGEPEGWRHYYKQGYRAVPVNVIEIFGYDDEDEEETEQ